MNIPANRHLGLLVLFGAAMALLPAASGQVAPAPHRLLVKVRRNADPEMVKQALDRHCARLRRNHRESRISTLTVDAAANPGVADSLRSTGLFRYVEPDCYAEAAGVPNDDLYESQWHLGAVQASTAWIVTTGQPGAIIAVIDSGVDGAHPDLAPRLVPGWSFLKSSDDTSDTMAMGPPSRACSGRRRIMARAWPG